MALAGWDGDPLTRDITARPEVHVITARVLDDSGAVCGDVGEENRRRSQGDSAVMHFVRLLEFVRQRSGLKEAG